MHIHYIYIYIYMLMLPIKKGGAGAHGGGAQDRPALHTRRWSFRGGQGVVPQISSTRNCSIPQLTHICVYIYIFMIYYYDDYYEYV
jgi:hypothetical protein